MNGSGGRARRHVDVRPFASPDNERMDAGAGGSGQLEDVLPWAERDHVRRAAVMLVHEQAGGVEDPACCAGGYADEPKPPVPVLCGADRSRP